MPITVPPRGVRKVSELITQNKRALILSEEDASKLNWADIPVSTLKINSKTGIMSVKIEGESDWVPAGIKNDGTLVIAKDGKVNIENFTIKEVDHSRKTFSYILESGDVRHSIIDDKYGFVFNLEAGSYQIDRNQVEVIIDDILIRSKTSGGLFEISENKIGIKDILVKDQEITIKYNCALRIGNPYPRFFLNSNEPDAKLAEIGDFWLDYDATMEQELGLSETEPNPDEVSRRVNWNDIIGRPDTLYGMGIKDKVSYQGHTHQKTDIVDFPTSMRANGGNADTVNGFTANSNKPGTLAVIGGDGKLPASMIPAVKVSNIVDFPTSMRANGGNADTVQGLMPRGNNPGTLAIIQNDGKLPATILPRRSRADIVDFPTSMPANGGNADTVRGVTVDGHRPNTLVVLDGNGKIPLSLIYNHRHSIDDIDGLRQEFDNRFRNVNANTLNGFSFSQIMDKIKNLDSKVNDNLLHRLSGRERPGVIIPLIDWERMKQENGGQDVRNIINTAAGIVAYGGDTNFGGRYPKGTIILKQSYKNFDKILVCCTNDGGDYSYSKVWDKWELEFVFANSFRFEIAISRHSHWQIRGNNIASLSTETLWRGYEQNCGVVEIYGINY